MPDGIIIMPLPSLVRRPSLMGILGFHSEWLGHDYGSPIPVLLYAIMGVICYELLASIQNLCDFLLNIGYRSGINRYY